MERYYKGDGGRTKILNVPGRLKSRDVDAPRWSNPGRANTRPKAHGVSDEGWSGIRKRNEMIIEQTRTIIPSTSVPGVVHE